MPYLNITKLVLIILKTFFGTEVEPTTILRINYVFWNFNPFIIMFGGTWMCQIMVDRKKGFRSLNPVTINLFNENMPESWMKLEVLSLFQRQKSIRDIHKAFLPLACISTHIFWRWRVAGFMNIHVHAEFSHFFYCEFDNLYMFRYTSLVKGVPVDDPWHGDLTRL